MFIKSEAIFLQHILQVLESGGNINEIDLTQDFAPSSQEIH